LDPNEQGFAHLTFLSEKLPFFSLIHVRQTSPVHVQSQLLSWQLSGAGDGADCTLAEVSVLAF